MSTRSNIIVQRTDGSWKRIYAHWDGYISGNGRILQEHYNSQFKADRLVAPGDISSLDIRCSKPKGHTFDKPVPGYTTYYSRDRGEKEATGEVGQSLKEVWPPEDSWTEFVYVYGCAEGVNEPKWFVGDPDDREEMKLIPLVEAIEIDAKGENPIKSAIKSAFGVLGVRA